MINNTIDNLLHKIEGAYADNTIRAYRRNLTNLNNQLSKQIGELLELEKRYAK